MADGIGGAHTKKMTTNISTNPLWQEQAKTLDCPEFNPSLKHTQVAIIGGGYTGLAAAYQLRKSNIGVAVFEQHQIGYGASSRNGGKALVGLKEHASTLCRRFGKEMGRRLWQASVDGIDDIEHIIQTEKIDCHFERCGSFFAAAKTKHYDSMQRETEWLAKNFNYERTDVPKHLQHEEVGSDAFFGGVVDSSSAGIHPAMYVVGLAEIVQKQGALLFQNNPVTQIQRKGAIFEIHCPNGSITADEVLIATNGYTPYLNPSISRRVVSIGSYIIATEPLEESLQKELSPKGRMFYDSKWFLNYFRLTPDGRFLFGGRTTISPNQDLKQSATQLEKGLHQIFPLLKGKKVTHSWSGNLGLTFDALPHFGKIEGIHYCLGYCGHGVALSTHLGIKVANLMTKGEENSPFHHIPAPTSAFYRKKPWFRPVIGAGLRVMDLVS